MEWGWVGARVRLHSGGSVTTGGGSREQGIPFGRGGGRGTQKHPSAMQDYRPCMNLACQLVTVHVACEWQSWPRGRQYEGALVQLQHCTYTVF